MKEFQATQQIEHISLKLVKLRSILHMAARALLEKKMMLLTMLKYVKRLKMLDSRFMTVLNSLSNTVQDLSKS